MFWLHYLAKFLHSGLDSRHSVDSLKDIRTVSVDLKDKKENQKAITTFQGPHRKIYRTLRTNLDIKTYKMKKKKTRNERSKSKRLFKLFEPTLSFIQRIFCLLFDWTKNKITKQPIFFWRAPFWTRSGRAWSGQTNEGEVRRKQIHWPYPTPSFSLFCHPHD